MEKEHKIYDKVNKWWGLHYKCVMFVLVLFLLFAIIGWIADRCTNSYRYLGTASLVLSIVLSIVVIVYTIAQNVKAVIDADRITRLVENVREDTRSIKERIFGEQVAQVTQQDNKEFTSDDATQVGKGELFFSLLSTSDISRLFAYFLLRSNIVKKPLSIDQFIPVVDPIVKMSTAELSSHVYGILHGMVCCLKDVLIIKDQTSVQLSALPKNYENHLRVVISWMIARNSRLKDCIKQIDNIV